MARNRNTPTKASQKAGSGKKTRINDSRQDSPDLAKVPDSLEDINGLNGNGKIRYRSLVIHGTKYRTRLNQKFEKRKTWENPDQRKVISSIPGTIIKIYVAEGQEVKQGDKMLVLEAMKMKNRIVFHTGGTVKSIYVREGDKIPKDHLMLELN